MSRSYKYPTIVTYWIKSTVDRFGSPTWIGPKKAKVRWEDGQRIFLTNTGRELKGRSTIYTESDFMNPGDHVYKGSSNSTKPIVGAFEILAEEHVPSLRGNKTTHSYVL